MRAASAPRGLSTAGSMATGSMGTDAQVDYDPFGTGESIRHVGGCVVLLSRRTHPLITDARRPTPL
jgi:hypothetical protein